MWLTRFTAPVSLAGVLGVLAACGGRSASSLSAWGGAGGRGNAGTRTGGDAAASNGVGGSSSGARAGSGGSSSVAAGSGGTSSGTVSGGAGSGGEAGSAGSAGGPQVDERFICSGAGWLTSSEVVLSHTKEGLLTFVHADGNVSTIDLTYPDKPSDEVHQSLTVTANGALIAVASGWSSFSPTLMASVALFERSSGQQRFHTLLPGYYLSGAFQLSADDSVVVGVRQPTEKAVCVNAPGLCDGVLVVEPDGSAKVYSGYSALGPRIDGHLLVVPIEPEDAEPVWLDFETQEETPLAHWVDRIDTLQIGPDSLRYLAQMGDLVQLVTETPTSVDVLPLEGLAEVLDPDSVRYQVGDQELAYPVADGSSVWRLDLRDGSLENTQLPLPEGVTPLLCYNQGVFPDDTGALTLPVRDEASAWVMRWEGDTGPERLGEPVTDVQAIQLTAAGGTYFIRSWAPGSLFCDEEMWADPGRVLLSGDSLQLVRPTDGIFELLDPPTASGLNANGTCFYESTVDGLFVRDVFRAQPIPLPVGPDGFLRWVGPS